MGDLYRRTLKDSLYVGHICPAGHDRIKLCKVLREFPDKFREYYSMEQSPS